ncbi:hypothetical protein MRY82_09330 [bacterium]|nr:hypothetical protein [bacterium]
MNFKGRLVFGHEARIFQSCGEDAKIYWLIAFDGSEAIMNELEKKYSALKKHR